MDYILLVKIVKCLKQAGNEELGLLLCEFLSLIDVVSKVSSRQVVHADVQVVFVLECEVHVDYELMFKFCKDRSLVNDRVDASFGKNAGLCHFFHGIDAIVLLHGYLPNFPEATLSDAVRKDELALADDNCFVIAHVVRLELAIAHYFIIPTKQL